MKYQIENKGSTWYNTMSIMSNYAKQMGKELYCYEGGLECDPVSYTNYKCDNVVINLQSDPPANGTLNVEIYDTLAVLVSAAVMNCHC